MKIIAASVTVRYDNQDEYIKDAEKRVSVGYRLKSAISYPDGTFHAFWKYLQKTKKKVAS